MLGLGLEHMELIAATLGSRMVPKSMLPHLVLVVVKELKELKEECMEQRLVLGLARPHPAT